MNVFEGTIRNGQIILDVPAVLPDGMRVEIMPIGKQESTRGMREEDWPTAPQDVETHLKRMDQIEHGWLSAEDDAAWRAAVRAQKNADKARFKDVADGLERTWQ